MKQNFYRVSIWIFIFTAVGLTACTANRSSDTNLNTASSSVQNQNTSGGAEAGNINGNTANNEQKTLEAEKEKLQKEVSKLEKEKQNLKDEKAKNERMQGAAPPLSQPLEETFTTGPPPVNIRDSPNGKILCVVKKQATFIKIYGSTGIEDNNGEWFYTKHCGRLGVIHSSQFVSPG